MKHIRWNKDKNEWLKKNRGVCFEQVMVLIEHEKILEVVDNPNQNKYHGQKIAIAEIDGYMYLVPYEENEEEIELKTIIPSRKAMKKYKGVLREKNSF